MKSATSYYDGNVRLCYAVNQYIITQYKEADQQGVSEFELILPDTGLGEYSFSTDRISQTLYNHGIISRKIAAQQIVEDSSIVYQDAVKKLMRN